MTLRRQGPEPRVALLLPDALQNAPSQESLSDTRYQELRYTAQDAHLATEGHSAARTRWGQMAHLPGTYRRTLHTAHRQADEPNSVGLVGLPAYVVAYPDSSPSLGSSPLWEATGTGLPPANVGGAGQLWRLWQQCGCDPASYLARPSNMCANSTTGLRIMRIISISLLSPPASEGLGPLSLPLAIGARCLLPLANSCGLSAAKPPRAMRPSRRGGFRAWEAGLLAESQAEREIRVTSTHEGLPSYSPNNSRPSQGRRSSTANCGHSSWQQ